MAQCASWSLRDVGVKGVDIDVSEDGSAQNGAKAAGDALGGIDVLVKTVCAGALENRSGEDSRRVFEGSVFGR